MIHCLLLKINPMHAGFREQATIRQLTYSLTQTKKPVKMPLHARIFWIAHLQSGAVFISAVNILIRYFDRYFIDLARYYSAFALQ